MAKPDPNPKGITDKLQCNIILLQMVDLSIGIGSYSRCTYPCHGTD